MKGKELRRLLDHLQRDSAARAELDSLEEKESRFIEWARAKGYSLSETDVRELLESRRDLSDDDLDQVAGGDEAWGGGTGGTGTPTPGGGG